MNNLTKINLINSVQKDYLKLTNIRISKNQIQNNILPLFFFINKSKKNLFLLSGSQGSGKTTLLKILNNNFYKYFKKRLLTLSLDDFYYDNKQRKALSKSIHPLMITRGVPGTHNIKEIINIVNKFEKNKYPILIPIFDKLKDKTLIKKRIIHNKCDRLILEGWCCGAPPIHRSYLYKDINLIEKKLDKDYSWRNFYNNLLKKEYRNVFNKFDYLIYFKASSFKNVLKWRKKQEFYMKKNNKNKNLGMRNDELKIFLQHYEKLTKWMIKVVPKNADLTIFIDKNQKIKKISSV